MTNQNHLENIRRVFQIEIDSLNETLKNIDHSVNDFVEGLTELKGKLIVSGIGKSGLVGQKICATLASTGTESFFVHATEAFHGDLGMINSQDGVLLLSNSGETDEVLKVLNYCLSNGIRTFSITGNVNSTLAQNTDFHLLSSITQEACILNLAPTSSTTTTMVLGDALAVALMKNKDFQALDFAKYHPGGSLGRKLLGKVKDYMIKDFPRVDSKSTIIEVIEAISKGGLGVCTVFNQQDNTFIGVVTDGDLRRYMQESKKLELDLDILQITSENPKRVESDLDLASCELLFQEFKINTLVVEDNQEIVGLISKYTLPK